MIFTRKAIRAFGFGVAALALSFTSASAQGWQPTDEVVIVSHTGTSSSTWAFADVVSRAARELDLFPNGVKVEIVEGARGGKARAYVAKDNAGDPHYLQVLTPTQINNPILARSDVDRSLFRGVALMLVSPKVLTVNADSPYQSMDDVIAEAKKRPGELIHGGGDFGTTSSLVSRIIEDQFGVDFNYTPFDDQGILQLLGGHIDFVVAQPELVGKFQTAGRMRMLATSQKLSEFPDVPTFVEEGYDFPVLDSWRGFWTSKDVPDEAIAFYADAFQKIMESDIIKGYMSQNSMNEYWLVGDDLEKQLDLEVTTFKDLAEKMNLTEN
jgi:putative tricarboxylic transport membrane protein